MKCPLEIHLHENSGTVKLFQDLIHCWYRVTLPQDGGVGLARVNAQTNVIIPRLWGNDYWTNPGRRSVHTLDDIFLQEVVNMCSYFVPKSKGNSAWLLSHWRHSWIDMDFRLIIPEGSNSSKNFRKLPLYCCLHILVSRINHCDFKPAVTRKSRPCRDTLRVLIKQIAALLWCIARRD